MSIFTCIYVDVTLKHAEVLVAQRRSHIESAVLFDDIDVS